VCFRGVDRECAIVRRPPASSAAAERKDRETRQLALSLDSFSWQGLELESTRLGVPVEELIGFAIVYYLADLDSGRVARTTRLADRPQPDDADTMPG
jgi:hypothetical protein